MEHKYLWMDMKFFQVLRYWQSSPVPAKAAAGAGGPEDGEGSEILGQWDLSSGD